jgi:hypothetical protein
VIPQKTLEVTPPLSLEKSMMNMETIEDPELFLETVMWGLAKVDYKQAYNFLHFARQYFAEHCRQDGVEFVEELRGELYEWSYTNVDV